jgi:hypothetical protein
MGAGWCGVVGSSASGEYSTVTKDWRQASKGADPQNNHMSAHYHDFVQYYRVLVRSAIHFIAYGMLPRKLRVRLTREEFPIGFRTPHRRNSIIHPVAPTNIYTIPVETESTRFG